MDSGKRFEERFSASLKALPGWSHRIEDGGRGSFNKQPGDYLYGPEGGGMVLIECKAAKGRFELRRIGAGEKDGQLAQLLEFQAKDRRSVVAINFYGDDYRKHNRCILIPALFFIGVEGASITEEQAARMGVECPRVKIGKEYGYDLSCLTEWIAYRGRQ